MTGAGVKGAGGPGAGVGAGRGIAVALLAITLFAAVDVCSKLLGQRMSPIQVVCVRFVLFVPVAVALTMRRGEGLAWRSGMPGLQLFRSLLLPVQMWFYISAFAALPLADVQAIGASAPLLVTALSVPLLGERVGWRRWSAVMVGFAGVVLIVRPGFAEFRLPMLYVVAGTTCWAFYQIILKVVGRVDSAATTGLWTAVIGAISSSVACAFVWTTPDATGWWLLLAAALTGGLGHIVYSHAFSLAPASTLQPFNYLLLVYAAILGWLVFGDVPDGWTAVGATLVVASGLYTFHRERRRRPSVAEG